MKVTYDGETDILRIRLNQLQIDESNEVMPGIIVDVDAKGQVIGFEILAASKRVENPQKVELKISTTALRDRKSKKKAAAS
jgi:uncharacterized protein YuzE